MSPEGLGRQVWWPIIYLSLGKCSGNHLTPRVNLWGYWCVEAPVLSVSQLSLNVFMPGNNSSACCPPPGPLSQRQPASRLQRFQDAGPCLPCLSPFTISPHLSHHQPLSLSHYLTRKHAIVSDCFKGTSLTPMVFSLMFMGWRGAGRLP